MAERPEDLNLPTAVITRIIKDAVPEGVNVSKEARLAISKAASVFILYATSCANNFAMKANRKTLNAQDIMKGMEEMEFSRFNEPLKQCLESYRKVQKGKKEASEKKKKAKEQAETPSGDADTPEVIEVDDGSEEGGADDVEEVDDDDDDVEEVEDDDDDEEGEEDS